MHVALIGIAIMHSLQIALLCTVLVGLAGCRFPICSIMNDPCKHCYRLFLLRMGCSIPHLLDRGEYVFFLVSACAVDLVVR